MQISGPTEYSHLSDSYSHPSDSYIIPFVFIECLHSMDTKHYIVHQDAQIPYTHSLVLAQKNIIKASKIS